MEELFLTILNMSLTASYVITVIMVARLFLKKAPKVISYILWAAAGFRLAVPFSFESVFSMIPFQAQPIPQTATLGESVSLGSAAGAALRAVGDVANGGLGTVTVYLGKTADGYPITTQAYHSEVWLMFGSYLWLIGIAALLIYSVVSIVLLKRRLSGALLFENNIYEAANLKTPFVLGFFRPKIYLPSGLSAEERSYIILHEQTHIKRFDHVVKFAAFLILCVHWFNPLVWFAFMMMSTDMELSCDERVLKEMGNEVKKPYAASLLSLATEKRILNGSPLAFGEANVKGRIKNVLNFKKPAPWVIIAAIVFVAVLSIGFTTNKANDGIGDYDFYNFSVNGFMLGVDTKEIDTSSLIPTEPLNVKDGYEFNYEEVRYSADENTGRLRKMFVHVLDGADIPSVIVHKGEDAVDIPHELNTIEQVTEVLGQGKNGWQDREQRLRYMEYRQKEGRLSATVRFVYTDGESGGIAHRLVWVIAESSLPYPYPYPAEQQFKDLRPMIKVGDILYLDTNKEVSIDAGDLDIIGKVVSSVAQHEKPTENGQTNFGLIGSEYAYYDDGLVVLLQNKWIFFEKDTESTENTTDTPLREAVSLQVTSPKLSTGQSVGVDMVQLDYASDDIVIFHDYFGLFVYDQNTLEIMRSLDLNPIGCAATQGDDYCEVLVSADGNTVQLHPMSSEKMYIYTVSDNALLETTYQPMEERFNSFVPIEDVLDSSEIGNYSHHAVKFDTYGYGYLHTTDGTIGELVYVRGDMLYRMFGIKEN